MSGAALPDVIEQDWDAYTPEQHAVWRTLFRRQEAILAQRACREFLGGLAGPGITADGIPEFRRLNQVLRAATGWTVVAVPGLVPDAVFFEHLANRRFPATCFIRSADQLDYLEEPDVFHDIFGHVPMLMNPVFADYMQAYGAGGLKALKLGGLHHLARLYWYTVEFGLIRTANGARIYGSGIVSSKGESIYCLESAVPKRLGFDLLRVMRTRYHIDDFQPIYFVIDSFEQLFAATRPDFTPCYAALAASPDLEPETVLPEDRVIAP
ncbi:MAG TPA: phenylalanine 4-monooxygenase [Stellaceae bacterium]|nr:phenylalanine 4-monooxygenase [Stellaceae bacterium]